MSTVVFFVVLRKKEKKEQYMKKKSIFDELYLSQTKKAKLLNTFKAEIKDEEFLMSTPVKERIQLELNSILYRYELSTDWMQLNIYGNSNDKNIANTNGDTCNINVLCNLISKQTDRNVKYMITKGLSKHELGHRLYTPMKDLLSYKKKLSDGTPILARQCPKDLKAIIKSQKHGAIIGRLFFSLANILEDGFIEYRLLHDFELEDLEEMREVFYEELTPVDDIVKTDNPRILKFMSLLMYLAEYKKLDDNEDSLVQYILTRKEDVFSILSEYTASERAKKILLFFYSLSDLIIEVCQNSDDNTPQNSVPDNGQCSNNGSTNNSESSSDDNLNNTASTGSTGKNTDGNENPGDKNNNTDECQKSGANNASNKDHNISNTDRTQNNTYTQTEALIREIGNLSNRPEIDESMSAYNPIIDGIDDNKDKTAPKNEQSQKTKESKHLEFQNLLTRIAEQKLDAQQKNQLQTALQSLSRNEKFHKDVKLNITIADENRSSHNSYTQEIKTIKRLHKEFIKQLGNLEKEDIKKGLYFGKELNASSFTRADKKFFADKRLPSPVKLSVLILIDLSGSMTQRDRWAYTEKMSIIISEFCDLAGIRCAIYGHNTTGTNTVNLVTFSDFAKTKNDKYRLFDIGNQIRGCNRDGYAVSLCINRLREEPQENKKILISLSDGKPNHTGYGFSQAVSEFKDLFLIAKRSKINIIGAAIGEDKDQIKKLYQNNFIDMSVLENLPKSMIKLIKKQIDL